MVTRSSEATLFSRTMLTIARPVVKQGDRVKAGQMLARVGNSGASGVPYLHFAMTDGDGLSLPGRYRFSVYSATGWSKVEGIDIAEGWHFRSE